MFFEEHYSITSWIHYTLSYKADGYSWYVNMYIGLFLMIPFLNVAFNGLKTKKEHIILVLTFVCLSGLPVLNNIPKTFIFFPDWWRNIWPIAYYFIGSYLKRYQPSINKLVLSIVFFLTVLLETVLTLKFSGGKAFSGVLNGYHSIFVVVSAVCFFMFFIKCNFGGEYFRRCIRVISNLTLDIYLASYIVDLFVYQYVRNNVFESNYQIIYYFVPIVGTVVILSVTISLIRKYSTEVTLNLVRSFDKKLRVSKHG